MKKKLLSISIFYYLYKVIKIYRNKSPSHHFGEFAEDIFVNRVLKNIERGKYVDVGCYHPFKGSLTLKLYKKKWSGINIDLSKTSIDLFNISRKKDINLNIAITNFNGETFYYENSPINQQNSLIRKNENQKKIKVECFTLDSILKKTNIEKFDYLNIDVEGSEFLVLKGTDLKKFNPSLISIENNDLSLKDYMQSEIYNLLVDNEYTLVNIIGVTYFFMPDNLAKQFQNLIKI